MLLSFIPMYYLGVTANIMSLGGIAIAIGALVDAAIIMVEKPIKARPVITGKAGGIPGGSDYWGL